MKKGKGLVRKKPFRSSRASGLRGSWIRRSGGSKTRKPSVVKKRPRQKALAKAATEWARQYHSKARVLWVKTRPSVVSGKRPCENCHTETGGTSRKADYQTIVPLTKSEHRELHRIGQTSFEAKYRIDLKAAAAQTELDWQAFSGTSHTETTCTPHG